MKMCGWLLVPMIVLLLVPYNLLAQGMAGEIRGLQQVLETLYEELIPLCGELIGVGRAVAGFAATWYIAARVWRHIAAAEPIDFYPLFRPFALGLAIMLFPSLIGVLNGVLSPTVTGTGQMVKNSKAAIAELLRKKEEELKKTAQWQALVGESGEGDRDIWLKYYHKDEVGKEGFFGSIGNDIKFALDKAAYNFKNAIKRVIATVLEILYEAASLCINTLRTFNLVILAIIGPLILGLAVFDGFQHTLPVYLARYINVFLWLPLCNILGALLGKIQENMIKIDLSQIAVYGQTFFSTYDLGYMIFLIIGIFCFFTVPSIADQIVHVGGGSALQHKITQVFSSTTVAGATVVTGGAASMVTDVYGGVKGAMTSGMSSSQSGNYFADNNDYMRNKLSG